MTEDMYDGILLGAGGMALASTALATLLRIMALRDDPWRNIQDTPPTDPDGVQPDRGESKD